MKKILFSLFGILLSTLPIHAQWDLNRCLDFAKANNKALLAQKQQLRVADYEQKIAAAKFLPEVNLAIESSYYWKIPVQSYPGELFGLPAERVAIATGSKLSGNYDVHINWNAVDMQSWQNSKLEKLKGQSVAYGIQSMEQLLLRNVTAAFYNIQIERQNKDLSDKLLAKHLLIHQLLSKKFQEGLLDKIAINQSTAIRRQYEKYQAEQEMAYQKAVLDLKYWMGFPLEEPLELVAVSANIAVLRTLDFKAEQLPDYQEKEASIKVAQQRLQASKYYRMPQLSLGSSFGQIGFGEQLSTFTNFSKWHSNGYVGFRLRIPLFAPGGAPTVKRNRALYKQTTQEFVAYQDQEKKRYLQLQLDLKQTATTLNAQEDLRKLAEENLTLCNQKIEAGIMDMIQLQQIQQELIKTVTAENKVRLDYLKNQIELNYLQNETQKI